MDYFEGEMVTHIFKEGAKAVAVGATKVQRLSANSLVAPPGLYGKRTLASTETQLRTETLREKICPHTSVVAMARSSGHLQNNHMAIVSALVLSLGGSPAFAKRPKIGKSGARFQNLFGTNENQAAHILPCNPLLNNQNLPIYFGSLTARKFAQLYLGGVMLGSSGQWNDAVEASVLNTADFIVEDYDSTAGSVAAMVKMLEASAQKCGWTGEGRKPFDVKTTAEILEYLDKSGWRVDAAHAYERGLEKALAQRSECVSDDQARRYADEVVRAIEAKATVIKTGSVEYGYVAESVAKVLADEPKNYLPPEIEGKE